MTVLVLAEDLDPTADQVIDELNRRGVPLLRCDTAWFPQRLSLDAWFDGRGWDGVLRTADRQVHLRQLRSIWYRHPTPFQFPGLMTAAQRRHLTHEAKLGLGGVLWSLPVLWVNHPAQAAKVAYKPLQQAVAADCGLSVPATRITNEPDGVREFATTHPGGVVLKQLGFASINDREGRRPLFTRLLTDQDLSDLTGVEHTAHTFQRWVDKVFDARITVVGGQQFPVAVYAGTRIGRVDFRADYDTLTYEIVQPPGPVCAGIDRFMNHFGLAFGAFDFAVDRDGRWWFLECNPGGQYGWID